MFIDGVAILWRLLDVAVVFAGGGEGGGTGQLGENGGYVDGVGFNL